MVSQDSEIPILSPAALSLTDSSKDEVLPSIIVVTGPTACGKSALALEIAKAFKGTIINADSMQIYHDLSLLTAKPSYADMACVPHKLYSILSATDTCSVARWLALAHAAIYDSQVAGRLPIIVGGTGLYIEVLRRGLAPVPEIPTTVRAETHRLMASIGSVAFHAKLAKRDPAMAIRLHPSDQQRLQRAWEVITATGYSLLYWWDKKRIYTRARFFVLLLRPTRPVLQKSCDRRFWRMATTGGISEVTELIAQNLPRSCPVFRALGVAALIDYIQGRSTLEEAILAGQTLTRHYAKRQCTWFRRHITDALIIPDLYSASDSSTLQILTSIRKFLSAQKTDSLSFYN